MPRTTSSTRAGNGSSSSRRMARASRAGAPPRTGAEAWPPGSVATSSTSRVPFSARPTTAVCPGTPGKTPLHDRAPLVDHRPRPDAARRQGLDGQLCADAEDLLVVAEGEVDVAGRDEARGDQGLDGFQDGDQRALVVDRAAAVDETVGDPPGERVLRPVLPGHRHDVVVGHQHQGRPVGPAAPAVEQGAVAEHLAVQRPVRRRVQLAQPVAEARERAGIDVRGVARGHSRQGDQLGQPGGRGIGVQTVEVGHGGFGLRGAEAGHPPAGHGQCRGGSGRGGRDRETTPHAGSRSASSGAVGRAPWDRAPWDRAPWDRRTPAAGRRPATPRRAGR